MSNPETQGLDPAPFGVLDQGIRDGRYGLIDRMVVVRSGYLVVNHTYVQNYREASRGFKGTLGCGTGACEGGWTGATEFNYYDAETHPFYRGSDVHSLQSVTKSVTAALIGIAIRRGEITGVEAPLLSFLEDYDLSRVDGRLHQATLEDLLTMRSGIEWHEQDRPLDSTNTTAQLEASQDWVQFTLDQPMDADPGEKWAYSSGGSHLMSAIVRQATGQTVDRFAQTYLFGRLGIASYHWKKTPKGLPDTEGGLYLEAAQLAKFGYLYLNDGVWEGERLLPEGWVQTSTDRLVNRVNRAGWGYGYQWWRLDRTGVEVWAGLGFGGQYLIVLPAHQLIGVINSWNIFGRQGASILPAFLDALITSATAGN